MVETPFEPNWARSNWQSYCVRLPTDIDQKAVMQRMLDKGVATRRGIMCIHREAAYRDCARSFDLSHSEAAQDHCIILPLFPQMTDDMVETTVSALRSAVHG